MLTLQGNSRFPVWSRDGRRLTFQSDREGDHDGKTLRHINLAMVALMQLAEYRSLSSSDQAAQQWIVLLHDLAKEPVSGRDHRHSFRSAAQAGRVLPTIGFPVTAAYESEFTAWFQRDAI